VGTDHNHHDHHHHHGHHDAGHGRAFAIGVALNLGFVALEAAFGLYANSLALLADAGHNLSDVFGLLIAWGAARLGQTPPSPRFTYGLRASSILAALTNGIVLMLVAGGLGLAAIQRFVHPQSVAGPTVIAVAAAGIVVNGVTALLFHRGREHDLNIQGAFLHMAGDAAVSAGVVAAGIGIAITGWRWLDPAASLLIVGVIVWSTWSLLRRALAMSLGGVPDGIDPVAVERFLAGLDGVAAVHDLHIWPISTTATALTAHLVMPGGNGSDAFLHDLSQRLATQFGIDHATVQVERDAAACRLEPRDVV